MTPALPETSPHQKARVFLFDRQKHKPAANVRVEALAEFRGSEEHRGTAAPPTISLGTLQSDHAGYVSFDLEPAFEAGKIARVSLTLPSRPDEMHELPIEWDTPRLRSTSLGLDDARALAEPAGSLPYKVRRGRFLLSVDQGFGLASGTRGRLTLVEQ